MHRTTWAGCTAALLVALVACSSHTASPVSSAPAPTSVATTATTPPPTTAAHTPSATHTSNAAVPPVSALARADGLLDVRSVVPDAIVDLRYATAHNFTGVQLYPSDARCLVHESMAPGLRTAAARLRRAGYRLVFWDCYRPHAVQVRMFQVVPNANWVARPGPYATSHESGRSVDVTIARAQTGADCAIDQRVQDHCLIDMGTGFDDFTARAYAYTTSGLTSGEVADRAVLREAMAAGGLSVYSGEWWHFDGPGAFVQRPILRAPVD